MEGETDMPRMLDLFCGRFGWSRAFAAKGWECVGVDLVEPPEVPERCTFVKADALDLHWWNGSLQCVQDSPIRDRFTIGEFDFICVSSPCTEFSTMRNFRPPVPYPANGIALFNHARRLCAESGIPYVMENVAGAQRFVGPAIAHAGSFYLWGNAVPPLLPRCTKGMTELAMGLREHKGKPGWDERPNGRKGQTDAAHVATIPEELANCVAQFAERLLEQNLVGGD